MSDARSPTPSAPEAFPLGGADPALSAGPAAAPADPAAAPADAPASAAPVPEAGHTRTSAAWVGVVAAALVLVLLLVFIIQNLRSVRITYFTATGSFPLGAALLLAAVGGVLLAAAVASLRILQLRRRLRRGRHPRRSRQAAT